MLAEKRNLYVPLRAKPQQEGRTQDIPKTHNAADGVDGEFQDLLFLPLDYHGFPLLPEIRTLRTYIEGV
jgi:hypothetical protein